MNSTAITFLPKDIAQILSILDEKMNRLWDDLSVYDESQLCACPKDEHGWSVLQVCYHLLKAEEMSLFYVKKKLSFNSKLKKASLASEMRIKLLKTSLRLPIKFKAPDSVGENQFPSMLTKDFVKQEWIYVRASLHEFLEGCDASLFDMEIYKHPSIGKMTLKGMLTFFDAHFDRHRKQIRRACGA